MNLTDKDELIKFLKDPNVQINQVQIGALKSAYGMVEYAYTIDAVKYDPASMVTIDTKIGEAIAEEVAAEADAEWEDMIDETD